MNYLNFFNTALSVIILVFLSTFNITYLYFRFFFSKEQKTIETPNTFGCSDQMMDKMDRMEQAMDKYNEVFSSMNKSDVFISSKYDNIINNDKHVKEYMKYGRDNMTFEMK